MPCACANCVSMLVSNFSDNLGALTQMADLVHSRILLNAGKICHSISQNHPISKFTYIHVYIYIFIYSHIHCRLLSFNSWSAFLFVRFISHGKGWIYTFNLCSGFSIYSTSACKDVCVSIPDVAVLFLLYCHNIVKSLLRLGGCKNDEGKKFSIIYRKSGFVIRVCQPSWNALTKIFLRIL